MGEITLLVGNGINRTENTNGPSWERLLENLQQDIGQSFDLKNDFKPFPMAFEEMLLTNCSNYDLRLRNYKKSISKTFLDFVPNPFHAQLVNSKNVRHIFTTNYDYGFERVLVPHFSNTSGSETQFITKEIKHNLRRRNVIGEKSIWHIHGEIYDPKTYHKDKRHFKEESILLGYEHYSESLKVIQDYRIGRNKWARTPLKTKLSDDVDLGTSWVDYFFTSRMLIFGLDLSFSEIDLWYVLNYRARLLSSYSSKANIPKALKRSKLLYFVPNITKKNIEVMAKKNKREEEKIRRDLDKMKARAELLLAFGVEIENITCKSYDDFYQKIIDSNLKP
ncbi:MAG: hypothetical protein RL007_1193 [Bacteroidota bacterium]|jgi:hypothetical protein